MKLLVTKVFRETHSGRLAAIAPSVELVDLSADLDPTVLDLAFFSPDCYPERAPEFMSALLGTSKMRWMHTFSAGVDHPIFTALTDKGIRLTTSSGAAADPIAQAVVMYLLALARQLPQTMRNQMEREWVQLDGRDLSGTTTVVLGFGPIGRAVANLLPVFGSKVIALRRAALGDESCEIWALSRLHEALSIADQLVLALPANADTIGMLDKAALECLPESALVVNVGRGELIDEGALVDALEQERIAGAALDVFVEEPLPEASPLWDLPNVIITPHMSARTPATNAAAVEIFFDNLARFVEDSPLLNEV
ncbi:MAG: D-2-hydroxyacid dehydrogenase [Acidimicrobiales bacterium]